MDLPETAAASWATLVIDVQNDFCHPDGGMAKLGADISANGRMLEGLPPFLDTMRTLGSTVIFVTQTISPMTSSKARAARMDSLGRDVFAICQAQSWGARIHDAAGLAADDLVVEKHRYSAFVDTSLPLMLRALEIRGVVIVGTAANVCVDSTARDAFMRDLHVVIPRDLVGYTRADLAEPALTNLDAHFATVCGSRELIAALGHREPAAGG